MIPAYCNRALNHVLGGELEAAAALYQRAIDLSPSDPNPHAGLGALEAERQQNGPAADHLQKAIDLGHPGPEVRSNLAFVLERLGEGDRALELWRDAHVSAPANPGPLLALTQRTKHDERSNEEPFVLGRFQRYDLYRHLEGCLHSACGGPIRCGHDFRHTVGWAYSRGLDTLTLLSQFLRSGAGCDCEIVDLMAEGTDGALEFARLQGRIRTDRVEAVAGALLEAGAKRVDRLGPTPLEAEDDPESWPLHFVPGEGQIEIPPQPAAASRVFRLLEEVRIALNRTESIVLVLRSTTDLVRPTVWMLGPHRALEIDVRWRPIPEDATPLPDRVPPMNPSTFHIQPVVVPWFDRERAGQLAREKGLESCVWTREEWALLGNRVGAQEPALVSVLEEIASSAPDDAELSLRWVSGGRYRLGWIRDRRLAVFELQPILAPTREHEREFGELLSFASAALRTL